MNNTLTQNYDVVIIGGGIGGVSCAEVLAVLSRDDNVKIALISASPLIKAAVNIQQIGYTLESMEVQETDAASYMQRLSNVDVLFGRTTSIDSSNNKISFVSVDDKHIDIYYKKLCLATGASPKKIWDSNPHILTIRDTESVNQFQKKLSSAERLLVVGNGGIATELVYEVRSCHIVWCIKHKSISAAFFDESAASFFLPHIQVTNESQRTITKRWTYGYSGENNVHSETHRGNALGPDWSRSVELSGAATYHSAEAKHVVVEYCVEVECVMSLCQFKTSNLPECTSSSKEWPVYVRLTNGKVYGADIIVNATGVQPSLNIPVEGAQFKTSGHDGGLVIDMEMRTSVPDIYAVGDLADASGWTHSKLWHQMRLWTQAKQMGCYAGKCMLAHLKGEPVHMDFCFEIFNHVTEFFGFRVVLLGLYNAQGLDRDDYTILLRCTKGREYVKAVVQNHRLIGAVLIGDTELEETFENLILNQLDISHIEDNLLEPEIDIEDYFD